MKKLLNNPWFAGALVVGALVAIGDAARSGSRSVVGPATDAMAEEAVSESEAESPGRAAALSPRDVTLAFKIAPDLRNPFVRAAAPVEAAETVEEVAPPSGERVLLSGIWSQDERTFVLLNGRVAGVGDRIGGFDVVSAGPDGVWLDHARGRDFLPLGASLVVAPSETAPPNVSLP